jgi:rSAM/selenodomain-associated transferase 1
MKRARLVILAKTPVPGRVKSRLAASVGASAAARRYQRMLAEVACVGAATASMDERVSVGVYFSPRRHPVLDRLSHRHGFTQHAQPLGDLGARLRWIAHRELVGMDALVIIGGDCVGLSPEHLHRAFDKLHEGEDVVLAPAGDGGYTLIGLRSPARQLFLGIPWGGPDVLRRTLRQANRAGLSLSLLPTATDLDDMADLKSWRRRVGANVAWRPRAIPAYDGN